MQSLSTLVRFCVVLGLLQLVQSAVSWACSCAPDELSTEEKLDTYQMVFVGEVKVERVFLSGCGAAEPVSSRVEVVEAFKGVEEGDIVEVRHQTSSAACGMELEKGERRLFYMDEYREPLVGNHSICEPGGPVSAVEDEVEQLRSLTSR